MVGVVTVAQSKPPRVTLSAPAAIVTPSVQARAVLAQPAGQLAKPASVTLTYTTLDLSSLSAAAYGDHEF